MPRADDELACQEFVELVTGYLEGRLGVSDRLRFLSHLAACTGCRAYVEHMRATLRLLGTLSKHTLDAEARARLLGVYREWKAA